MSRVLVQGGRVITASGTLDEGAVLVEDGVIRRVYARLPAQPPEADVIDANGLYVSPGFIDLHVHGGGGGDFLMGEPSVNETICKCHLRHGSTSIVPTLSASSRASYDRALTAIAKTRATMREGPNIPGVHMEGPYFAQSQRGAQAERFLRDPDPVEYLSLLERFPIIRRWSLAPELPGGIQMGRDLGGRGVRLSIGHSDALFEDVLTAFQNGFDCITHLYSSTSTVSRVNAFRRAGIVEAAFYLDQMTVEIIADGKHLPPSLLRLIYKIKGPEHICLVTDGISASGQEGITGEVYDASSKQTVLIEDGVAKLPDRQAFAGSIAATDVLVRNMVQLADVPIVQAVKMMTATPARMMGLENRKGSIAPGMDADLVLFDEQIQVRQVMVGGRMLKNDQASR